MFYLNYKTRRLYNMCKCTYHVINSSCVKPRLFLSSLANSVTKAFKYASLRLSKPLRVDPLNPSLPDSTCLLVGEISLGKGSKYNPRMISLIFSSGVLFLVSNLYKSLTCLPKTKIEMRAGLSCLSPFIVSRIKYLVSKKTHSTKKTTTSFCTFTFPSIS